MRDYAIHFAKFVSIDFSHDHILLQYFYTNVYLHFLILQFNLAIPPQEIASWIEDPSNIPKSLHLLFATNSKAIGQDKCNRMHVLIDVQAHVLKL